MQFNDVQVYIILNLRNIIYYSFILYLYLRVDYNTYRVDSSNLHKNSKNPILNITTLLKKIGSESYHVCQNILGILRTCKKLNTLICTAAVM